MLKIPRVNVRVRVNFIEQAFQPSTTDEFSSPPYGVNREYTETNISDVSC